MTKESREDEGRRRAAANRDADENTREPIGALEGPARPGTIETGRPDREELRGERMRMEEVLHQRTREEDLGDQPSRQETHREDRKELTQQRAQSQDRMGDHETDTQGSLEPTTADVDRRRTGRDRQDRSER